MRKPFTVETRAKMSAALKGNQRALGHRHSPETIAKMSRAAKERWASSEERARLSAVLIGRRPSAETRARISASRIGQKNSPEARAKISAALKGNQNGLGAVCSAEHRAAISAAHKGKRLSLETRAKMSRAMSLVLKGNKRALGHRHSPETRAKISAALKGRPHRPCSLETRAKLSASGRGKRHRPLSEKTRAKMALAHKGRQHSVSHVAAIARGLRNHPNRLERRVLAALIDASPEAGWKFNDGVVVAGKIPDFVRSDTVRLAVDVHGDYWHRAETPAMSSERRRLFSDAGWQLVIVWEHEFNQDPIIMEARIKRSLKNLVRADPRAGKPNGGAP